MTTTRVERIYDEVLKARQSNDLEEILRNLFRGALNWPISDDDRVIDLEDITYDWSEILPDSEFDDEDGPVSVRQIMPFPGWPIGIFFVNFGSGKFFELNRGMIGPLREVLKKLSKKTRADSGDFRFDEEKLLFICHSEAEHFHFARFSDSEESNRSRLQTFGFGPNSKDEIRTLCEHNLSNLYYDPKVSGKGAVEQIASAFSVSKVSDEFYKVYKSTLDGLSYQISKISAIDSETANALSHSLLNRLMFIRFLEKKGWLKTDNQTNDRYLLNLFQKSKDNEENFYETRLHKLFFEGLSIEGMQDSDVFGTVPFVGGSLFQEGLNDKLLFQLNNTTFDSIIGNEGLLYSWNFTVAETTPLAQEVAINPEMLGLVFEKTATEGMGAFYTPTEVVSYMCKEGIVDYLVTRTNVDREKIIKLVHDEYVNSKVWSIDEAKEIRQKLDELKAIDPACGSGAYLVGLLTEIVLVHKSLSTHPELENISDYELKKSTIKNNIHGSDIDRGAVDIAKLRLYLALIVAAEERIALPNLDFKIEVGDSLCAPNPQDIPYLRPDWIDSAKQIGRDMDEHFEKSGPEAGNNKTKLTNQFTQNNEELRGENYYPGSTDFLGRFVTIFSENGGFDLVLANPPYVRQEDLPSELKNQLSKAYDVGGSIRKDQNLSGLTRRSDLYCYFYVRAMQLLRNGGTQIFICSNSWLDVDFGIPLKRLMAKKNQLTRVIDSTRERQFQSAAVNTILTFAKKGLGDSDKTKFDNLTGNFEESVYNEKKIQTQTKNGNELDPESKWSLYTRAPNVYFDALENGPFERLDKFGQITRGFTSGANDFFFIPKGARPDIEDTFLIPVIKTPREVTGIMVNEGMMANEVFLCSPSKAILKEDFQGAFAYIKEGEEKNIEIKRGKDRGKKIVGYNSLSTTKTRSQWYTLPDLKRADVLMRQFYNDKFDFPLNPQGFPCDHTFYYIHIGQDIAEQTPKTELEHQKKVLRLGSFLNSSMSWLFVEVLGRKNMGEGVLTCYGPEMRPFPIIPPDSLKGIEDLFKPLTERPVESVFDELGIDPNHPISGQTPKIKPDRKALDDFVFDVVGLSEEQRTQVYLSLCEMVQNRLYKAKNIL